jgi:hypothetical protein
MPKSEAVPVCSLTSFSAMSPQERVRFLESLTPAALFDEIGSTEIAFHVARALQVIGESSVAHVQKLDPDAGAAKQSWNHLHVLSWYSRRFRPASYLQVGGGPGAAMAMIAVNNPETHLVSWPCEYEQSLGRLNFRVGHFLRRLTGSGLSAALTLVGSDRLAGEAPLFSGGVLRLRGRGQPEIKQFDLILVDGSRGQVGVYRHLKSAFARCALGGMVVFRGKDQPEAALPGKYSPRLSGYWERLLLRFPGFRYIKAPPGREIGLAFRVA